MTEELEKHGKSIINSAATTLILTYLKGKGYFTQDGGIDAPLAFLLEFDYMTPCEEREGPFHSVGNWYKITEKGTELAKKLVKEEKYKPWTQGQTEPDT
jgi:hypothetical protein